MYEYIYKCRSYFTNIGHILQISFVYYKYRSHFTYIVLILQTLLLFNEYRSCIRNIVPNLHFTELSFVFLQIPFVFKNIIRVLEI